MDQQQCLLTLMSFSYNTDEVKMRWIDSTPVAILKPLNLPDYTLTVIEATRKEEVKMSRRTCRLIYHPL